MRLRGSGAGDPAFDGDLSSLCGEIGKRYGPNHAWSASRLESYRACPFSFFVGSALALEPRQEPEEGLDVAQKGTLYHRILEHIYQHPRVRDRLDLAQLLEVLPEVAGQVLDDAPDEIGFRETAWWAQTRAEMIADIENTLRALVELPREFVPCRFEARFGLEGQPPLEVRTGGGSLLLHGVIDRVDRAPDGRVRIIDYKSSGPTPYTLQAVLEGKKLQLPIYALAARDALGLGEPVEGFYWHIRQAGRGSFHLSAGDDPGAWMQATAGHAWDAVEGIRAGRFAPRPPDDGCPPWCPAAGFCWHLRPRFEA
jgi:ATP-dependent helicase/DNAse subunit B